MLLVLLDRSRGREIGQQSDGGGTCQGGYSMCYGHICGPQKICASPNPSPLHCECDLIWKSDLCRCDQVKARSSWIRTGPNAMTRVLIKGDIWSRHTPGQGGHVMTEAETGGEEHPGRPANSRSGESGKKQILPRDVSGPSALLALGPRETEVCCLSSHLAGVCRGSPGDSQGLS